MTIDESGKQAEHYSIEVGEGSGWWCNLHDWILHIICYTQKRGMRLKSVAWLHWGTWGACLLSLPYQRVQADTASEIKPADIKINNIGRWIQLRPSSNRFSNEINEFQSPRSDETYHKTYFITYIVKA